MGNSKSDVSEGQEAAFEHAEDGAALHPSDGSNGESSATLIATGNLTGTVINQYHVEERLGGGAMAAVYRAHDTVGDRSVAIKVLLPGADSVMQARFRREARMVSTLLHPHIVRTLEVGRSSGVIYIVMELVEGASLGDVLERQGKLTVADTAMILAPVAEALSYAHEQGIVHRDVKPSNILLQRAAPGAANSVTLKLLPFPVIPLLSDFGIARALDAPELTNAGRTIGTPAFMAPEQCAGSADIDGRADVYALGAVLYRCLVGRPPFAGTTTQILHAHVYDPLLIPDAVAESLPPQMVRVMARAMMKDPAQRFDRIERMAAELRTIATLPEMPTQEAQREIVDPTMTMASLPVATAPSLTTSRILVPAAPAAVPLAPRPAPLKPGTRVTVPATTAARAVPSVNVTSERARSRKNQWGILALGGAFVILMALLIGLLINSFGPGVGVDEPDVSDVPNTPVVVAESGTPQQEAIVPELAPQQTETAVAASETVEAGGVVAQETVTPLATVDGTVTPIPTPSVPLPAAWEQAQSAYADEDWASAVDWLTIVRRILEGENAPTNADVDEQRVADMLTISYVGLAAEAASMGRWDEAIEYTNEAIEVAPAVSSLGEMLADFTELAELQDENSDAAQERRRFLVFDLAERFDAFAVQLEASGRVCDAALQLDHAVRIAVSEELRARQGELDRKCAALSASDSVAEVGGYILYSTGGGPENYNIWSLPVNASGVSSAQLVVSNAAQPQLNPYGNLLAYYSRQAGRDGLFAVRLVGMSAAGGAEQFGPNPEDSRDSPPTWDTTGTQIAFSTGFGNSSPHIYVTTADSNTDVRDLGIGKDPAWRPRDSVIVFNGPNNAGQDPGLRAMSASGDGSDRWELTFTMNGNDQRPAWSPDGRYVVFMSRDRIGGSTWEVYRLDWNTGEIILLTDGAQSQEGLPTVSPDGKWVVFVSDRGGRWKLWYVSIEGGEIHFLSDMNGQPIAWLEHSIQWVR
jgi:serine/threonine-protein kinase